MQIKGIVGNKTLKILLDTGSSHNFLSEEYGRFHLDMIKEIQPLQVTVVYGGKVMGTKLIETLVGWGMQGHRFQPRM